jgi:glycosyltransferase involved in cell wall biosynthesis
MVDLHKPESFPQERPLISFALLAYKQEQYIREAVEGAFSQTYSPLEIILSDDCSPDRTFDIMREMAAQYNGPHQVVLTKNTINQGLADHINKACALAKGKFIVAAAGDDISLPERTACLYDAWENAGPNVNSIFSDATYIDENGKQLGTWFDGGWIVAQTLQEGIGGRPMAVLGCTHMFSRQTFEIFGPIPNGVIQEDNLIPFRSLLLGRVEYVPTPLVLYRRHGENMWQRRTDPKYKNLARRKRWLRGEVATIEGRLADTKKAVELGIIGRNDGSVLYKYLRTGLKEKLLEQEFLATNTLMRILKAIDTVLRGRLSPIKTTDILMASIDSVMMTKRWIRIKKILRIRG